MSRGTVPYRPTWAEDLLRVMVEECPELPGPSHNGPVPGFKDKGRDVRSEDPGSSKSSSSW